LRAALIPPMGAEYSALSSDIHLVLPLKECRDNPDYLAAYRHAWRRGDYLILDNGCAEGKIVDNRVLIQFARTINAHEVVAPDVMGDGPLTLRRTVEFVRYVPEARNYSIMGVLQGENIQQVLRLAEAFAQLPIITAVGIPKILVSTIDHEVRARVAANILKVYGNRFEIHLLGLNRDFQTEMLDVTFPPEIRSMDSAQPYKFTEAGIVMTAVNVTGRGELARRRHDYFSAPRKYDAGLLASNIETFMSWCR